jgi:hypothetical protein
VEYTGEDERLTAVENYQRPLTAFRLWAALSCRITQHYDTTLLQTGRDVTMVVGVPKTNGKEGSRVTLKEFS